MAAQVAFSGQDPTRFLTTRDSFERARMHAIADEYQRIVLQFNEDLAIKIINKLSEAMK